jgi:hypothetical protein
MSDYLSRARTPTSPSPSPEPVDRAASAFGLPGDKEGNRAPIAGPSNPPSQQQATSTGDAGPALLTAGGPGMAQSKEEVARQVLEEKIQIGIDDLMQLAMCAGDVQPGDEDIVRMKM